MYCRLDNVYRIMYQIFPNKSQFLADLQGGVQTNAGSVYSRSDTYLSPVELLVVSTSVP